MANATDVVGYSYNAGVHCESCTRSHFDIDPGNEELIDTREDGEGNPVHPLFLGDAFEPCECCSASGKHPKKCNAGEYDCENCDGDGSQSMACGDCGEELVS